MERVRVFLLCSFFFVFTLSMNEAFNVTKIEFITVEAIQEKRKMNEPYHYVCRLSQEQQVNLCKDIVKTDFALRNNIEYMDGERVGEEMMCEFLLNDGLGGIYPGITPVRQYVQLSACICPTLPTPLYIRNEFGKETSVQVYVRLPFSAHCYS